MLKSGKTLSLELTQLIASHRQQSIDDIPLYERAEIRAIYYWICGYNLKAFYKSGNYSQAFTMPHILVKDLVQAQVLPRRSLLSKRLDVVGSRRFTRYTCDELDSRRLILNQDAIHAVCLKRGWDYGNVMTALAMLCGHNLMSGVTQSSVPELGPTFSLIHQGNRHLRGSIIGDLSTFTKTASCLLLPTA